jgi:hypothetical protein
VWLFFFIHALLAVVYVSHVEDRFFNLYLTFYVHYLYLIGWVYVFYVGQNYETLFHVVILKVNIIIIRWVSSKGLGPAALLRHTLEAKHILTNWRDSYSNLLNNSVSYSNDKHPPLSDPPLSNPPLSNSVLSSSYASSLFSSLFHSSTLTKQMYNAYLRWRAHDRLLYR